MPESENLIPRHLGFILDGNRRWAKKHGLPIYEGHLAGYNAAKDVAFEALAKGVEFMSVYIFSTENWNRSKDEVTKLMGLILKILQSDVHLFNENNVKLKIVGLRDGVDSNMLKAMDKAEAATASNTGGVLAICFNYGGQQEIADAVKKIIQSGAKPEEVTTELIAENLYAPEVPAIDMMVRTSGEQRISNFMLWRIAYSELMFIKKMWPDMTKDDVADIMKEYARRHRRFGG
jgi:undecaprenyl diphosphate synthase